MLYGRGVDEYSAENWLTAINSFEEAAKQYYIEYHRCMAFCDAAYDASRFAQFYRAASDEGASKSKRRRLILGEVLKYLVL